MADAVAGVLDSLIGEGGVMLAYAALGGEPDLDPVIDRFLARGGTVYLPVVMRIGQPLQFAQATDSMASLTPRGQWGIREPDLSAEGTQTLGAAQFLAEAAPDIIFIPALGFSTEGVRLGNGGGFYDRTFGPRGEAPFPIDGGPCVFGVCFASELDLPGLVAEDWDLCIGAAVTEGGIQGF